MRSRSPQNFCKSLPSLGKAVLECELQTVLPHRDSQARRVMILRLGRWDTSYTTPEDIFSTNLMCLELLAKEQRTQISGTGSGFISQGNRHWRNQDCGLEGTHIVVQQYVAKYP